MPCVDAGPTDRHTRAAKVLNFLHEVQGHAVDHARPDYRAHAADLDVMTAALCAWCRDHDVSAQSLDLQLWWRDHQLADARRAAETRAASASRLDVFQTAWATLTPQEQREFLERIS